MGPEQTSTSENNAEARRLFPISSGSGPAPAVAGFQRGVQIPPGIAIEAALDLLDLGLKSVCIERPQPLRRLSHPVSPGIAEIQLGFRRITLS
jgi:hypothetical protein